MIEYTPQRKKKKNLSVRDQELLKVINAGNDDPVMESDSKSEASVGNLADISVDTISRKI